MTCVYSIAFLTVSDTSASADGATRRAMIGAAEAAEASPVYDAILRAADAAEASPVYDGVVLRCQCESMPAPSICGDCSLMYDHTLWMKSPILRDQWQRQGRKVTSVSSMLLFEAINQPDRKLRRFFLRDAEHRFIHKSD